MMAAVTNSDAFVMRRRKVLKDPTASKSVLKRRAQGLRELGRIFTSVQAPDAADSSKDARQQIEDALLKVMEKRVNAQGDV